MGLIPNNGNPAYYGIIGYSLVGLSYSFFAATAWPCIPYLVPSKSVGTAIGIGYCFQALGIFIGSYIVGIISVNSKGADGLVNYSWICLFLGIGAALATISAIGILIYDLKKGGVLMSKNPKETKAKLEATH
jgi:MFS family permease